MTSPEREPIDAEVAAPDDVLAFWRAAGPDKWFKKDDAFDAEIAARFSATYDAATRGDLGHWSETAAGALALVLVLDQFPRNIFRASAQAYSADAQARAVAETAIARGFDRQVAAGERPFFYLPFEHSEALADQERAVALFRAMGDADLLHWAELHADIIRRFGRFPHRNGVLRRESTAEERDFLSGGGFSG